MNVLGKLTKKERKKREKEMKGKTIAVIVTLAIIFGGEANFIYYYALPGSIKEKREIWTPDQFHIANQINGSQIIGSDYKSDAKDIRSAARDFTKTKAWLVTDPQMPKSIWWYSDCIDVGFRVVCEADSVTGHLKD